MRISGKRADRKWGDLVNKMGTLVEDMVAPNIPGVAEEYFGTEMCGGSSMLWRCRTDVFLSAR